MTRLHMEDFSQMSAEQLKMPDIVCEKPKDRFNFVYISMVLFGTVSILPWSFFVTADSYWKYRFRDPLMLNPPENYKTALQKSFASYLIISSKVPLLVFLLINSVLNARLSPEVRVIPSLIVNIVVFSLHCALAYYNFDYRQMEFLGITLGSVALVNVASAFLQGAFLGIASCLPPQYVGAFTYGQGVSSISAAVVQILTLLAANSPTVSAVIYFAIAVVILIITMITFMLVRNSVFYKFYVSAQVGRSTENLDNNVPYCHLYSKLWKYILTVALVYWVSLSLIPPLQVMIVQSHYIISKKFFIPVCVFLIPTVGDFLSRVTGMYFPFNTRNGWLLLLLSVLRFGLIPLTMYCNLQPREHLPVAFKDDIIFVIVTLLVSVTNGYVQTVALAEAPKLVEVKYQETVGSILAFGVGIGLVLGSVSSLGLTALI